jgi:hypothetical protein
MSRNSRVRDRGYVSSHVSIAAATYSEFTLDYLVVAGGGGGGVVILRYPDTRTITIGAGLTGTESSASGGYKRATITAGTGNVSWA